jgi:hypothetical protein
VNITLILRGSMLSLVTQRIFQVGVNLLYCTALIVGSHPNAIQSDGTNLSMSCL